MDLKRRKYYLKNLDCADCAAKIERKVSELPGVRSASVSFATSTLVLEAERLDLVQQTIHQIEPEVELVSSPDQVHDQEEDASMGWLSIGAALVLFVLGLIFRPDLHATPYSLAEYLVFGAAYLLSGWSVLRTAVLNLWRGSWFDESFLMSIATLGAIAIHELPEAVGVMLFYKVGEYFQELAVRRSRRSIRALLAVRPERANLKRDGETREVPPDLLEVGDLILVRPGEKVPLDGVVVEGHSQLDTSALTGESFPRTVGLDGEVLAGMINQTGALTVRVSRPFEQSSIAKMLDLVQNAASRKARTERFITRFANYYTPAVVAIALGVAVLPPLLFPGATFAEWIYRALVLLVISCPCALMISIPLGYFAGVGAASRHGILVKGANFLDTLVEVKTVVFDKTGTLTEGAFKIDEVQPANGYTQRELLRLAAHAEAQSNHPIASAVAAAYDGEVNLKALRDHQELTGLGVSTRLNGDRVVVGNDALMHCEGIPHEICDVGGTAVHVAVNGEYAGYLRIADKLKDDAERAVRDLRAAGVERIVMLSGDRPKVAERTAQTLGLDHFEADLLPEDKLASLDEFLHAGADGKSGKLAFVGDGINDAPAIARADVGLAMGSLGSDAAIETADVVLMTDAPSKVAEAIQISRRTRRIVWQNIILAFVVKAAFIGLGITGAASMWAAVFADVGVTLLAVINATRILRS